MGDRQMFPKQTTRARIADLVYSELLFQIVQVLAEVLVRFLQVIDRSASMQYSCVVFASAVQANVGQ